MITYKTRGTCSSAIHFDVVDGKVTGVRYDGGCHGNLLAIGKLVEGMEIERVIALLRGTDCHNGTSCSDQLAIALEKYQAGTLK